jgi:CBS domain-containing protein
MPSHESPIRTLVLEEAIDRHPLIVTSATLLTETVGLMSQVQNLSCSLPNFQDCPEKHIPSEVRSNCVLVMEGTKLMGIFTERDLVQLIASGRNFDQVKMGEIMSAH